MGLDPQYAKPGRVFYAVHTYYALLVKLIASLAAARFAGGLMTPLGQMASASREDLRLQLHNLENRGWPFNEYGIRNFLEGDFFGWYLAEWDEEVEGAVRELILRLAEYDPGTLELAPENARDLLKKLYHYLLPREIRHDLGEYYTPDWLAERLIRQTLGSELGNPHKRVLDPACGSGTFLVLLINHVKREAERRKMGPSETLDAIRKNIIGFDLNPLAVTAARTNYILALGDLLREAKKLGPEGIDIPVYQCDSVLTPSRGEGLFEGDKYPLPTAVGVFKVPAAFASKARMESLTNLLDECIESRAGEEVFVDRLAGSADLFTRELEPARNTLLDLYRHLAELHSQELNGRWARIIKNAFAPLFIERCDYIVGNPPWVNWEHLPDEYRASTVPLWEHYGLFPHGGMDTILGKGKKDISMLMTYVAGDRYLRRGGRLGFVLSQTLFKTSGAGQGFRRFTFPDETPFAPLIVEDMVELKPFEGAANRTCVAIFIKGRSPRYPVSYAYWYKRGAGRGSAIGFDTPYEEVTSQLVSFRQWQAAPVDPKDATSAWITAKPKALRAIRNILGKSEYRAYEGSNTGGANGVYWVEVVGTRPGNVAVISNITAGAKRKVEFTQAAIESDLLYPLLRGRDVERWRAEPSAHIIMAQDPKTRSGIPVERMKREYPKAFSYLSRVEDLLKSRAAYRRYFTEEDAFWTMFNIGEYTFAPWKVVWREQASGLTAAVVGPHGKRPVIPDHKLMMVPVESQQEAYYLCGVLNSVPARLVVSAYAIETSISTHVTENVRVPRFSKGNRLHLKLAELSRMAQGAAGKGESGRVAEIEQEVDQRSCGLWGLTGTQLQDIYGSLVDRDVVRYEWEAAREATKRVKRPLAEELIRLRDESRS
jgi:SAM-dependent methyltransferase